MSADRTIAAIIPRKDLDGPRMAVFIMNADDCFASIKGWVDVVADIALNEPDLVGATFKSYGLWALLAEAPEGTPGFPADSTWAEVPQPSRGSLTRVSFHDVFWAVTPSGAQLLLQTKTYGQLQAPVLTTATIHELTSDPLELLADEGLSGPIDGFPNIAGTYVVQGAVNGAKYKKKVRVVPGKVFSGELEVVFDDGTTVPLARMIPGCTWTAVEDDDPLLIA